MNGRERNGSKSRIRVEVGLPSDLHRGALDIAEQLGVSVQAVISQAIASYVRNWSPPLAKKGKVGQVSTQKWPSGWPVNTPCPAGGCTINHDPLWHLTNEPRLVRSDNVRAAFSAAGLSVHLDEEED